MRWCCLFLFALASLPGYSAVLSAPGQTAAPGQVVAVPLTFSAEGQPVSGIQFDLEWDPALDVKLVIGGQLRRSSKLLYTSLSPHAIRCLIVGNNADIFPDGELIQLFLIVDPQAQSGAAEARAFNPVATSPNGDPVPLGPITVAVQIQSGAGIPVSVSTTGVLNAASLLPGPVSPGEIITLLGNLPASTAVLFNGLPATILYAGLNQVNAIVPFGVDTSAPADLEIRAGDRTSRIPVPAAPASPAIFTQNATGNGPGAILNEDFTPNSASHPAARNSIIMIYGTGFGTLDPQPGDGEIPAAPAATKLYVTASMAGVPAEVLYAGAAPGLVAGVVQVNIRVPTDVPPDLNTPLLVAAGGVEAPPVTVSIQ